jgi:hypothetical protein
MRGGKPVSWNEYITNKFGNGSVPTEAKEIGQKIFNENAKLEDSELQNLAEVEKKKGHLSDENYKTYFIVNE